MFSIYILVNIIIPQTDIKCIYNKQILIGFYLLSRYNNNKKKII